MSFIAGFCCGIFAVFVVEGLLWCAGPRTDATDKQILMAENVRLRNESDKVIRLQHELEQAELALEEMNELISADLPEVSE